MLIVNRDAFSYLNDKIKGKSEKPFLVTYRSIDRSKLDSKNINFIIKLGILSGETVRAPGAYLIVPTKEHFVYSKFSINSVPGTLVNDSIIIEPYIYGSFRNNFEDMVRYVKNSSDNRSGFIDSASFFVGQEEINEVLKKQKIFAKPYARGKDLLGIK